MEDIDKEISGMKIAINARARVVASEFMKQLATWRECIVYLMGEEFVDVLYSY